jgi:AhpD family alkylhydroperoxidase
MTDVATALMMSGTTTQHYALLRQTVFMSAHETHSHDDSSTQVHSYGKAVQDELAPIGRDLRNAIPNVYRGFGEMHAAAFAPGSLDAKTKELIALAIAVSVRCDGCIAAHARGAARNGATEAEVAETLGVTISMNGGPATVYGPRAFAAFKEFAAKK